MVTVAFTGSDANSAKSALFGHFNVLSVPRQAASIGTAAPMSAVVLGLAGTFPLRN